MRETLLVSAALLAGTGAASAQSVTIYGILDTAVEHITNVGPAGKGQWRMPSLTGTTPTRMGFRGSEDLGDGLRAVFTLEMGFATSTGAFNQGGRTFGRQAFVGLGGSWGTVTLGRQYTMLFWSLLEADVMGPNLHGTAVFDPYISNARVDNSIAYMGRFGALTAGATYSLGRDVVNQPFNPAATNCPTNAADSRACREWSAMLKYDTPAWGAAAAVDELRGGPGASFGLNSSALTDRRISINGYAKFGALKVGGGLIRRDNEGSPAPRTDLWYLTAGYPVTANVVADFLVSPYKVKATGDRSTLVAARATYNLSRRTAVYASLGRMSNDGALAVSVSGGQAGSNPNPGEGQSGLAMGVRHSF